MHSRKCFLTDLAKRKLSAKQIVADIRSGMDGTGLKRKYGLSDKALQSLCTKLLAAGALTENEIRPVDASAGLGEGVSPGSGKCPMALSGLQYPSGNGNV